MTAESTVTYSPDRRFLPPFAALLEGRLRIIAGKTPALVIDCWCAYCQRNHRHGWPTAHPTASEHRAAHCYADDSPYHESGYYIAPGGLWAEENRRTLGEFLDSRPDIVAALARS